jgi:pimeloyl-ACP methyl ester carboxylesterase
MNDATLALPTLGGKQLWGDCFVFEGFRIQRNFLTGHHRLIDPQLRRRGRGTYAECRGRFERLREGSGLVRPSTHLVVLLHGIFRAAEGWRPMARALKTAGYSTAAVTYPSTRRGLELHADQVDEVLDASDDIETVSFVTHSMGGLVAREVLGRTGGWRERTKVNRLVMIATPNKGAAIADILVHLKPFRELAGPAATQLTTGYVDLLAKPSCPFGVVAGVRGDGKGYNPLLPGDDDMTVSAASALLEGAEDTLVVPGAVHTFIMQSPEVVGATVRYLSSGQFAEPVA